MKVIRSLTNNIMLLTLVIAGLFGLDGFSHVANAASQIPFQLQAIHPSNQISKTDYDDLLITPGSSQELSFVVKNSDSVDRTFVVEANNAVTSDGIAVTYDEHDKPNLTSPMFSDLITNNRKQKITVAANSNQTVTFMLKYPQSEFEGVILGGVTVYLDDESNQSSSNNGFSITNRFTYSNAVQLRSKKELTVVPKLVANQATMVTSNGYPYVKVNLSNNPRAIITQMNTENTIKDSNGKIVETYKTTNGQVAPNSDFNLSIPLTNGALKAGKYHAIGTATSGTYSWSWDKEFEVSDNNSKEVDNESIVKPKINYWLYLSIILLLLIIVLVVVIIFLIIKNRKKEDEKNEKNN